MDNPIIWFDIPVRDLDRAVQFYAAVLGVPAKKEQFPGMTFAALPHREKDLSGGLTPTGNGNGETNHPSAQGPLLYFNCQGRLDNAVDAVALHGGRVLQPKHKLGPYGYRAVVLDSEGNRVALHST